MDNDQCCERAPKGDLDLLAACSVKAETINGEHVYYETQEECRFEGRNDMEFLNSLGKMIQTVSEEINEVRDQ